MDDNTTQPATPETNNPAIVQASVATPTPATKFELNGYEIAIIILVILFGIHTLDIKKTKVVEPVKKVTIQTTKNKQVVGNKPVAIIKVTPDKPVKNFKRHNRGSFPTSNSSGD